MSSGLNNEPLSICNSRNDMLVNELPSATLQQSTPRLNRTTIDGQPILELLVPSEYILEPYPHRIAGTSFTLPLLDAKRGIDRSYRAAILRSR